VHNLTFLLLSLIYVQVGVGCAARYRSFRIRNYGKGSVMMAMFEYTTVALIWPFMVSMQVFDYE